MACVALVALAPGCRYESASDSRLPEPERRAASESPVPIVGAFEEIALPAGSGAGQPFVAPSGADGAVVSWLEPAGDGRHALKFARISGDTAGPAVTIAERDDFFVNFADFPSVVDANGALFAHWLQKSGTGTYAYDVRLSSSVDGGATWRDPIVVHDDGVAAEHGFASLLPLPGRDAVGIVWLDGRHMTGEGEGHDHGGGGDMTLRYAEVDASLVVGRGAEIDARTCECCTTAMAMTPAGPLVAYRDRSPEEVRDIAVARLDGEAWRAGAFVADGWTIHGCPVNGPQADARGASVAVAWFTLAGERPLVRLAFSGDGGGTFGPAVDVGAAAAAGYVDVAYVADGRVAVTWLEDDGAGARLMIREALADGTMLPARAVATTTRGRTGFPRLALAGGSLFVAWNEKGGAPRIHLARALVSQ